MESAYSTALTYILCYTYINTSDGLEEAKEHFMVAEFCRWKINQKKTEDVIIYLYVMVLKKKKKKNLFVFFLLFKFFFHFHSFLFSMLCCQASDLSF